MNNRISHDESDEEGNYERPRCSNCNEGRIARVWKLIGRIELFTCHLSRKVADIYARRRPRIRDGLAEKSWRSVQTISSTYISSAQSPSDSFYLFLARKKKCRWMFSYTFETHPLRCYCLIEITWRDVCLSQKVFLLFESEKRIQESGIQTRNDNRHDESAGAIKRGKIREKKPRLRLSRLLRQESCIMSHSTPW